MKPTWRSAPDVPGVWLNAQGNFINVTTEALKTWLWASDRYFGPMPADEESKTIPSWREVPDVPGRWLTETDAVVEVTEDLMSLNECMGGWDHKRYYGPIPFDAGRHDKFRDDQMIGGGW
jgi:hypothetical protein